MPDLGGWGVVGLDEGEGGAWDFLGGVLGEGADEGAGEGGFAGAEGAGEENGVTGAGFLGEGFCHSSGLSFRL